jgi:hypothetical protein
MALLAQWQQGQLLPGAYHLTASGAFWQHSILANRRAAGKPAG